MDETVAYFEDPASGTSGATYVTTLITSYKVSDNLALILRGAWVKNSAPEGGPDPRGSAWSNGVIGANYSRTFGTCWRWTGFLGSNIPWGSGGGDSPQTRRRCGPPGGQRRAVADGGLALRRQLLDRDRGGRPDLRVAGRVPSVRGDVLSADARARTRHRGLLEDQLHRRGARRSLLLAGLLFREPSSGSNAGCPPLAPVRADPAARQQLTFGIGPRFHFKVGKSWFRPGVSYSRALDDPMARKGYDIVQLDLPIAF